MSKSNTNYDELSLLILKAVEEETYFDKVKLVPKIRTVLKMYRINLATANYHKVENPSRSAARLRQLEREEVSKHFWKKKAEFLDPENLQKNCLELDALLEKYGFEIGR
jgi:hypothetical protein